MKKNLILFTALISVLCFMQTLNVFAADPVLAFPGAEGGGKYSLGARGESGISVYHVTNLKDRGTGSLADAVSKSGRIVVFDVGGTINLTRTLSINKSNITILGQTAPGDGITITGSDVAIGNNVENVIMRYLRVRPTDKNGGEPDGIGGRWTNNVIIDHCSTSWGVDELLTLYGGSTENGTPGSNNTVQYTIASESLRMSNHFKGAHGYGAIFGATQSSWHHNLLAHHDSRSPRLDRELQGTDVRNNIIYNWGQTNSAYGAEPYSYNNITQTPSYVNWVNNYYKYGPGTGTDKRSRIFDVSNAYPNKSKSNFFIEGNYVFGDSYVTSNNWNGVVNANNAIKLTSEYDMGAYSLTTTQSAEDAYTDVLSNSGATLPKRDSIDARIVEDVKNQTGRIINNAAEVGDIISTTQTTRTFTIPSDWKTQNGMGSASETDIVSSGIWKGYTWIEAYVNDWTNSQSAPTNPSIIVTNPAIQYMNSTIQGLPVNTDKWTVMNQNEQLSYTATALPVDGTTITKVEIYDGAALIKSVYSANVNENISLSAGTHYLTSRAYNDKGESTQSPTSIVYVKSTSNAGQFVHTQLGTTSFDGMGGSSRLNGVYTIFGSGSIPGNSAATNSNVSNGKNGEKCDFMYQEFTGNFEFVAQANQIPKFENGQVSGLMVRESLDPKSKMVMLSDGWLKYGQNVKAIYRSTTGGASTVSYFKNSGGTTLANTDNYDTSNNNYRVPTYLKIARQGNVLTLSVSDSGSNWTDNPRQPQSITLNDLPDTLYVGVAVDSVQGTPRKEYMAEAKFSNVYLSDFGSIPTSPPTAEPTPAPKPTWLFSENGFADLISISTNSEIDGLTFSGRASIASSVKDFAVSSEYPDNSGFSYTKVCKIGNNKVLFTADGKCKITVDAVTANNTYARSYTIYAGRTALGTFTCNPNTNESFSVDYDGPGDIISIIPSDGINLYGINVKYGDYTVSLSDSIENGTIMLSKENQSAKYVWTAEENADKLGGTTNPWEVPISDESDIGTIRFYDNECESYEFIDSDGEVHTYLRGNYNPLADNRPFTESSRPTGNVFRFKTTKDGVITANLYIYGGKLFYLYDNNNNTNIENMTAVSENIYTFSFPCEANNEYYAWANGSKIGLSSLEFTPSVVDSISAKTGDTIHIQAEPNAGFRLETILTDPVLTLTEVFENSYTFTMPSSDVVVDASFVDNSLPTATPIPTPETPTPETPTPESPTPEPPTPGPTETPEPRDIFYVGIPQLQDSNVTLNIKNNTEDETGLFAVAVYDRDILKDIKIYSLPPNASVIDQIQLEINETDTVKAFLWNSMLNPKHDTILLK